MTKSIPLFALLLGCAVFAQAGQPAAPKDHISAIEGVYKHRFQNGVIAPGRAPGEADEPIESEDIIEIVRYDDTHVYLRAHLEFYNGHSCGVSGIAGYENGAFVFHDPEPSPDGGQQCTIKLGAVGDRLVLTDRMTPDGLATCRSYCGVRGSLSDVSVPLSTRRPIRYLDRIKSSRQYIKASKDLQTYQLQKSDPAYTPEEVKRRHQE